MEALKKYKGIAITQYEDLRDTIGVIEAMRLQGEKSGTPWGTFKAKMRASSN